MEYAIFLQILLELALAVSGEQELDSLLTKTSKAFHRKLDCTHLSIFCNEEGVFTQTFVSPHWAESDTHFLSISRKLSAQCIFENINYIGMEVNQHFFYAFILNGYGTLCIARGQSIAKKLVNELEPILDMLATNILACHAFKRQKLVEKELREQNEYIDFLAYNDSLTDLPNRRRYYEKINTFLNENESGGIILLDLDNFKRINDTLGHVFGDEVLKFIAKNLNEFKTESVSVFRFGGDEFLLLVKGKCKDEIESLVRDIFAKFEKISKIGNYEMDISFSVGITMFPEDSCEVKQLLMNADLALYSIKNKNKNGYRFFDLAFSNE